MKTKSAHETDSSGRYVRGRVEGDSFSSTNTLPSLLPPQIIDPPVTGYAAPPDHGFYPGTCN